MVRKKQFDCVEMKNEIQKRLYEERKWMTPQEVREAIEKKLETSQTPVALFWRKIRKKDKTGPEVAAAVKHR